jgi:membrane protein YdbS with pleckstrin-like domain
MQIKRPHYDQYTYFITYFLVTIFSILATEILKQPRRRKCKIMMKKHQVLIEAGLMVDGGLSF